MTDGFEEHIGCGEWEKRCDMCGTEQDEDSEVGMEGEDVQDVQSDESLRQDRRRAGTRSV